MGEGIGTAVWERLVQIWALWKAGEKAVLPHLLSVVLQALALPGPLGRTCVWLGC